MDGFQSVTSTIRMWGNLYNLKVLVLAEVHFALNDTRRMVDVHRTYSGVPRSLSKTS